MKTSLPDYRRKAIYKAKIAMWSILRDWIKGQITAVECGLVPFESAFMGNIVLPDGKTCFELALDKGVLQIGGQP